MRAIQRRLRCLSFFISLLAFAAEAECRHTPLLRRFALCVRCARACVRYYLMPDTMLIFSHIYFRHTLVAYSLFTITFITSRFFTLPSFFVFCPPSDFLHDTPAACHFSLSLSMRFIFADIAAAFAIFAFAAASRLSLIAFS